MLDIVNKFLGILPEILRTVNLIVGTVILIWLILRRVFKSHLYVGRLRNDVWLMALYWTSTLVVGTIEVLFNTGTSTRIVLGSAALIMTGKILWYHDPNWYHTTDRRDN